MAPAAPNPAVYTIEAGGDFARLLAEGAIARVGRDPIALSDVTIYVPTRRAARSIQDAFATLLEGASLGPRIRPLGDINEDEEIGFDPSTDDMELPPAILPLERRLHLATLVARWHAARGETLSFAQAVSHAGELARFLDETAEQGIDLARLKMLAAERFARHWQDVAGFLAIIAEHWPLFLADNGKMEPAMRRDALIRRQAAQYRKAPPQGLVIAAGSTGSIPATRDLLLSIATLPRGAVILPGLDRMLDENGWTEIRAGHAQYGLKQLLAHLGVRRDEVRDWTGAATAPSARAHFLSEALRPPPTTDAWRDVVENRKDAFTNGLDGLALIEAASPQEEALAIALALREALETRERTAALVTPDRGLARRVAADLRRWNITIDDSGGTPLARTPPGTFLCLLARASAEDFAPVPLQALLKHPFSSGGMERCAFLAHVRAMEMRVLRGLRPEPGLKGLAATLAAKDAPVALRQWFEGVAGILAPFAQRMAERNVLLSDLAHAHAQAAELLAATRELGGAETVWRGEAGEAAANLIDALLTESEGIPLRGADYDDLFRDLAEARVVRPRGRAHPRLALLGPLEARLQHFDLVILGGLNEGVWPGEAATDPWLSRPMREELGLELPERRIGLAAHDFATLAAAPQVLLTRALKQDGAPTNPSRWILRLKQLAEGLGISGKLKGAARLGEWAAAIDVAPAGAPERKRAERPAPKPPLAARPRRLRVTEIETLIRDPYAIHARHVLNLVPLDPLDVEPGPRERGVAVHKALEDFLKRFPDGFPPDAREFLLECGEKAFRAAGASPAIMALWRPRFARAADWFIAYERGRRRDARQGFSEATGELVIATPGGSFTLRGRADRIEIFSDGAAAILDYKTGAAPSNTQIDALLKPQLPLEGAMLLDGAFKGLTADAIREFTHVRLTGAEPAGKESVYAKDATAKAREALKLLEDLIAHYDNPLHGYRSREIIEKVGDVGDYDHLARVREWMLTGGDET